MIEAIGIGIFIVLILASLTKTRECRVCSREISKNAKMCPGCGEPY